MVQAPGQAQEISPEVMFRIFYYNLCAQSRNFHWQNRHTGQILPGNLPDDLDNPNHYLVPNFFGILVHVHSDFIPELQGYNWGELHGYIEEIYQDWEIILN
jgi:hypothetical protein